MADEYILSDDELTDLAKAPLRTRTDEGTVQERSIAELLRAEAAMAERHATAVPWGLRIAKTCPPGTDPGQPLT